MYFFTIPLILITDGNAIINNIFYQLYLLLVIFFYYAWFWKKYGQTLGMRIWKVKIFCKSSKEITYLQSINRIIVGILGGHIFLIFSNESLQDRLTGTYLERIN